MSVSVIIPTYNEAENLSACVTAIDDVLSGCEYEIVFMDDDSTDESKELVETLAQKYPAQMVVRPDNHGLSQAVVEGFSIARYDTVVVMDADLSHPVEKIPEMVALLSEEEPIFVVGSRYVRGGKLDRSWGIVRRLNSATATWLARPLVKTSDPMSGFFAVQKRHLPDLARLSPVGYKIGLEVMVKGNFTKVCEVPICFRDRQRGKSKMSLREQLRYLRHLRRLYQHRFTVWAEFFQFGVVGGSGFIIDLAFYLGLQALGLPHIAARSIAFWPAASWNWALNRLITFSHRDRRPRMRQWAEFVTSSLLGFCANVGTYVILTSYVPFFDRYQIICLMVGVLTGMGFNFMFSSLFVFRSIRQSEPGSGDRKKP